MNIPSRTFHPEFSIITPSFNMLEYLQVCCNSIIDQNVKSEHIVIDGLSQDGTVEWLKTRPEIISLCEKDQGMYDAINKGVKLSNGDIISYLNCDEQYLPGVLQKVSEFFRLHSQIDLLFGNTLMIRPDGKLLAYRKGFIPRWPYIWASHMYVHSCSMFVRRRVFESNYYFNKNWKTIGDADFVVRALRKGFVPHHLNHYFSAFMMTGSNLGSSDLAQCEVRSFRQLAPFWLRHTTFLTNILIKIEKLTHGAYWQKFPLSYSVFPITKPDSRSTYEAKSASPFYPGGKQEHFYAPISLHK